MNLNSRLALTALATALTAAAVMPTQAHAQAAEAPAWMSKVTLGADLRFRLQHTNDMTTLPAYPEDAAIIRARLGSTFKVNDQMTLNFRLASGASNSNLITTSHQTLGDAYQKKEFWLDIASMEYKPMANLAINAGKALNPFYSAGKNELVMDSDINPEGVNVKYTAEYGSFKSFATAAYNLVKNSGTTHIADVTQTGGQIGTNYKADKFGVTFALGMYNYNDVKDRTVLSTEASVGTGNTFTSSAYAQEYKLTNVELEATTEAMGIPLTAYGSYVKNSDAEANKDTGLLGGLRVGTLGAAGTWAVDYNYRDLQADAIISNFTDGDFGNKTGVYGHRAALSYVAAPNVTLTAIGLMVERKNTAGEFKPWERYNLEVLATF
jgi:hypothetical protein